jgi:protein required for attachment to host cells
MSWILIANRTGARIVDKQGPNLTLRETISHEAGRQRDRDVESDRQGRTFDRMGGNRHALSSSETPHDHDAKAFARELADRLRAEHLEQRFEHLVLVAEPRFLGFLREALDDVTARTVVATVGKDLAEVALHDLAPHLPELPQAVA